MQLLIGLPFFALIAARGFAEIGRTTWYTSGDDWWVFQRFAYRIYLQGYWLEGGEPAFWFQPFYRWIAGALHMVFGDSSVGELFWDGACAWAGAVFAFHVTRVVAGFRWGSRGRGSHAADDDGRARLVPVRTRAVRVHVGRIDLRARRFWRCAAAPRGSTSLIAGVCLRVAFYTRLNNLPFATAVAAFCLPVHGAGRVTGCGGDRGGRDVEAGAGRLRGRDCRRHRAVQPADVLLHRQRQRALRHASQRAIGVAADRRR